jgi:hypothetical protein
LRHHPKEHEVSAALVGAGARRLISAIFAAPWQELSDDPSFYPQKIMGVAVALIILMVVTAILSMAFVVHVGSKLDNISNGLIPAYGHLARMNIRSLERALALRRMVIERITSPSSDAALAEIRLVFEAKGAEMEREAQAARNLINGLIEKGGTKTRSVI